MLDSTILDDGGQSGLVTVPSPRAAGQSLDRVEELLKAKGIRAFARIDHAAAAREAGLTLRPTEVLIFGNPQAGTPLMNIRQTLGIDLPLKILAWEDAAGQSWLSYNDPQYLVNRHLVKDHPEIVKAMSGLLQSIVAGAAMP